MAVTLSADRPGRRRTGPRSAVVSGADAVAIPPTCPQFCVGSQHPHDEDKHA